MLWLAPGQCLCLSSAAVWRQQQRSDGTETKHWDWARAGTSHGPAAKTGTMCKMQLQLSYLLTTPTMEKCNITAVALQEKDNLKIKIVLARFTKAKWFSNNMQ